MTDRRSADVAARDAGGDPLPSTGRLLGIDWGERRFGLALSDPERRIAQPLATLTRRTGRRFPMQQLRTHLDAHRPAAVVLGLPLESDGTEGDAARDARAVGTLIADKTGLPVFWIDERLTTARALRAVRAMGGSRRERRGDVDQLAAVILLQAFLDRGRP